MRPTHTHTHRSTNYITIYFFFALHGLRYHKQIQLQTAKMMIVRGFIYTYSL